MNPSPTSSSGPAPYRLHNGWRIAGWSAAAALLALPAIAMQFTREVDWTASDFVFAAILIGALGVGVELAFRIGRNRAQRMGMVLASLTGFLTVWSNMAVGIIGSEDAPVNLGFLVLVAGAAIASLVVRFRSRAMARIMAVPAIGQFALGIYAAATMPGHGVEWGVLAFFAVLWSAAALLFHRAAKLAG